MFADDASSQENLLSKYTNARAICARMTDPEALYERGMLLASDENEDAYLAASDCFMAAATRNHTQAQIELGKMYEYGRGVPQSDIFAYKWYQTAVLLGDKSAVTPRNRLENAMSIDDIAMSIPLIQKTLDLLDMYAERQDKDLEAKEKELERQYSQYFNINLAEFDPPKDDKKTKSDNPLVEALIQAQLQKEAEQKRKQAEAEALARGEDLPPAAPPAFMQQPALPPPVVQQRRAEPEIQETPPPPPSADGIDPALTMAP